MTFGPQSRELGLLVATALRNAGYRTDLNYTDRSFKKLFQIATKTNALLQSLLVKMTKSK